MGKKPIEAYLREKIVILDGAMGTMLQQAQLTADDFGGERYEGCNEILNLTRPDLIRNIHEKYYQAGADVVETNTFGATPLVLGEYDLADKTEEINRAAAVVRFKRGTNGRPVTAPAMWPVPSGRPPRHCPSPGGRPLKRWPRDTTGRRKP